MDNLDTLVTHHLADRLLNPERLTAMLASLASRRAAKATAVDDKLQSGSVLWDADLCGFGVRHRQHTTSYILKCRAAGRQRIATIGKHGSPWTPDTGRHEALALGHQGPPL
jgi:hypothetical protein